jgi:hypothetical protein
MSRFINVISCKNAPLWPHRHATDRTKIYAESGFKLGPVFEVCPFACLSAKDAVRDKFKHGIKRVK